MPLPVQPMQEQPLEVKDFSGGMTDFYVGAPLTKFQRADNLLIVRHGEMGKLFTRYGSQIYDATYYQIPAGAQRIGTLKLFEGILFYQSARKFYYIDAGWQTLQGPTGNDVFPTGIDTTTVVSTTVWQKHLFVTESSLNSHVQKIFLESAGQKELRTAGMPDLATSPVVTATTPGTTFTYLYRYLYTYTYNVGTVTYVDRGPTTEVLYTANAAIGPGAGTAAHSAIPILPNGAVHNYDTSSALLRVEIYRTTDGGQNFFLVGSVANGATLYNDITTDTTLQQNEPLYTEGGFPENDPPPVCKLVHSAGTRTFYANVKVGPELLPSRVYQSIPDDGDAVPQQFFADVSDEIIGMSSVQNAPLLLCKNGYIYRVDGTFNEDGTGFLSPQIISNTAGCISSLSVVQTLEGVFWAGLDGFYFSDGFTVIRVSDSIRLTYQQFITTDERKRRIYGKYDKNEKRIYWSVQWAVGATDVDACFVLDINWGISENMPFTTLSGGTSFAPTALEFSSAQLLRADKRGYTFVHLKTLHSDPKVDTTTAPTNWVAATIIYDYFSAATDFGTSYARKWVSSVSVVCINETNLALQIRSINDDGRRTGDLSPIRFKGNLVWGDPDVYWGDPTITWNNQGLIDETRRMPAQSLRCEYKQIELTNAKVAIVNSDLLGTATVSNAAHTATLDDAADFDWPTGSVDYYLAFQTDNYVREYLVTARTNDVLTFSDPSGVAPDGSVDWVIRGYPKGEVMHLLSYDMAYSIFGKTQHPFQNSSTGEVGASS